MRRGWWMAGVACSYLQRLILHATLRSKSYLFLDTSLVEVGSFMRFWAAIYFVVSAGLVFLKHEVGLVGFVVKWFFRDAHMHARSRRRRRART